MFTAYDGHVPMAGKELDPTSKRGPLVSARMMETIGICPRRFFFRYALELEPSDDATVNPEQWLDGRTSGALLHTVFEQLIRESVNERQLPHYDRNRQRLEKLLDEQIAQYRDRYPPPSDSALQQQVNQLHQTAHTFLREEEQYCATHACVPAFLEVSLGMPSEHHGTPLDTASPVLVALADGATIRARGRIDRIDRIGEGSVHTYGIWDYKTGSDWGYDRTDPFQQGRKVQPYLYVTMVSHCMRQSISPDAKIQYFGFVFPGVKTLGRRIKWTPNQLADGKQVIERLCQVVAGGGFISTNNQDDCAYCDYMSICGHLPTVARLSQKKLCDVNNTVLAPFLALRDIKT